MLPILPRLSNPNAKRVWLITDTHLGVRNNSTEWIEIIDNFFDDFFFPLVEKFYKPGDVLIHDGDFFDSRQSVNLRVLNQGVSIAERLSKIFVDGIWILIGNHDIFGKNSNEVNSLKSIKWIPNITVCEEPYTLELGEKRFFMMPWRKDTEAEIECLEKADPHDYLCCHCDIRGLKFNKFVEIEHGAELNKFKKFGRVFSGHIHYGQEVGNIKMLGSPYELTRSDMGNPKGIHLLDLSSDKLYFFENQISPKFKRFQFSDLLEMNLEEINKEFSNNFVDIFIDPQMALKAPLDILTDAIEQPRRIQFHPHDPNQATNSLADKIRNSESSQFDVLDFVEEYLSQMDRTEEEKIKISKLITKLFQLAQQQDLDSRL